MRLPKQAKPVLREMSATRIEGQVGQLNIFKDIRKTACHVDCSTFRFPAKITYKKAY